MADTVTQDATPCSAPYKGFKTHEVRLKPDATFGFETGSSVARIQYPPKQEVGDAATPVG
jgi:hypothetical protein